MVFKLKRSLMKILKISETAAIMCLVIAGLFLILCVCGLLFSLFVYSFEKPLAYGFGLFIGCVLSLLKVIVLEKAISKALDMETKPAQSYAGLQAAVRYILTFGVLALVFIFPELIGLFGVIIGILTLQISAYITNHIIKKKNY